MATGVEKVSFVPMLKGNTKECSNYHIIALISHVSQVMLKILQARLQQYVNQELPDVQAGLEKAEEPEIKLPTSAGSSKKQGNSRKTSTFSSLITPKTFCDYNKLWEILKEMGISHHLACLLRNLYAGQEATLELDMEKRLVPNWKRSTSTMYIITLLIKHICRIHHAKCQAG